MKKDPLVAQLTSYRLWQIIAGTFSLFFVGLIAMGIFYFSSNFGRTHLKDYLNHHFQSSDIRYEIKCINQIIPLDVDVNYLNFTDHKGIWLSFKSINVKASVKQIFKQPHVLSIMNIEKIKFYRLQDTQEKPSQQKTPTSIKHVIKSVQDKIATFRLPCAVTFSANCPCITLPEQYLITQQSFNAKLYFISKHTNEFNLVFNLDNPQGNIILHAKGRFDDFVLDTSIKLPQLKIQNYVVKSAAVTGKIYDLPYNPNVEFKMLSYLNDQINLLDFKGSMSQSFKSITGHLKFYGFDTVIGAVGKYNYFNNSINSAVVFDSKNIQILAKLFNYELYGKCQGTVHILKKNDLINFKIKGEVDKFKGFDTTVNTLSTNIVITSALNNPHGLIKIKAKDLIFKEYSFSNIYLNTKLDQGRGPLKFIFNSKNLKGDLSSIIDFKPKTQNILINQFNVSINDYNVKLIKPTTITHKDNVYALSASCFEIMNMPVTVSAQLEDEKIDANLTGQLNLKFIERAFLINGERLKGVLDLKLEAHGPLKLPQVTGRIKLNNAYYENFLYGIMLKNINMDVQCEDNSVHIVQGTAQDIGKGILRLSGNYNIDQNSANLKLDLSNFFLVRSDALTLFTQQSNITVMGEHTNLIIDGNINLNKALFNIAYSLGNDVTTLNFIDPRKPPKKEKKTSEVEFFKTTNINMIISLKSPMRIYGKGLESSWLGDIKIGQTLNDPKLKGQLQLKEGVLSFLGQKLKLRRGSVLFDGLEKNMPFIDIEATMDRSDFTAIINAEGRADKLKFDLSSSPSMEQDEILAYILFGKEPGRLSPFQAIQLGRGIMSLKHGGKSDNFLNTITNNLGLDQLFSSSNEEEDESLNPAKKLMDRVNISFDQGIGPEDTKAIIEMKLTKRITLETAISPGPSGESVSLNYKKVY